MKQRAGRRCATKRAGDARHAEALHEQGRQLDNESSGRWRTDFHSHDDWSTFNTEWYLLSVTTRLVYCGDDCAAPLHRLISGRSEVADQAAKYAWLADFPLGDPQE